MALIYDGQTHKDLTTDINALALKDAITENRVAYNLPNMMIEQFQDDSKIGTETDGDRNASEWWSTAAAGSIDSYTKLLIHSDTSNGSTTFTDSSGQGHTLDEIGTTTHSTAQAKFGGSSIRTDTGTSSNFVRTPVHADFDLGDGTSPWTIDFWTYPISGMSNNFMFAYESDFHIGIRWTGTTAHQYCSSNGSSWDLVSNGRSESPTAEGNNQWFHVAMVFTGSAYLLFCKGILVNTTSSTTAVTPYNSEKLRFGGHGANSVHDWNGYFDEIRVSKGIARWTSAFTPPTTAYPVDTANATGTLISTAQTANASQTKVSGVILYKNASGTATLGTDLKIYFTCNGGTNWTESTPTAAGTFSSGILMAKCPEVTCTGGTDVRYKAVWANQVAGSKVTELHGIGMNY
tara:strand:- start:19 stop:1230 length:1212 start_codon:yes stop_codon:yes gene_type:complete